MGVHKKEAELIIELEDSNNLNGNYTVGAFAALGGAIVGAVPAFAIIHIFGPLVGVFFAVIPFASAYAYRKARGDYDNFTLLFVSIWSLIVSVLVIFIDSYLNISRDIWQAAFGQTRMLPMDIYIEFLLHPRMRSQTLFMLAQAILFCGIDILLLWRKIRKSNKSQCKKQNPLEEMLER